MKIYIPFLMFFCFLFLFSCSSIKVDVAVAKRELVEEQYNKRKFKLIIDELENNNQAFYNNFYKQFIDIYEINNIPLDPEVSNFLKLKIEKTYDENNLTINKAKEFILAKDTLGFQKSINQINYNMVILKMGLNEAKNSLKGLITENQYKKIDTDIEYLKNSKYIQNLDSPINLQRVRFSILGDINNSFITNKNANEELWNSSFNKNHVKTKFGHSDIAILLRNTPKPEDQVRSGDYNNNFTIKGVRLDDTDVMKAASDVLRQAVNIYSGGTFTFPKKLDTTNTNGVDIETKELTELANYKQEKNNLEKGRYKFAEIRNILSKEIDISKIDKMDETEADKEIERLQKLWILISNQTKQQENN